MKDYCCPESFIQSIQGNEIIVTYKYRTSPTLTKLYARKLLKYRIDEKSGRTKLVSIEEIEAEKKSARQDGMHAAEYIGQQLSQSMAGLMPPSLSSLR